MSLAGLDHPTPDASSDEGAATDLGTDLGTDLQDDRPAAATDVDAPISDAPAPIYEEVVAELGDPTAPA